jgi:hypothetical protein
MLTHSTQWESSVQLKQQNMRGDNMKKLNNDEMLDEYDFTNGVRGKYADKYHRETNVVVLEPDIAKLFPNSESVNQALRSLHAIQSIKS